MLHVYADECVGGTIHRREFACDQVRGELGVVAQIRRAARHGGSGTVEVRDRKPLENVFTRAEVQRRYYTVRTHLADRFGDRRIRRVAAERDDLPASDVCITTYTCVLTRPGYVVKFMQGKYLWGSAVHNTLIISKNLPAAQLPSKSCYGQRIKSRSFPFGAPGSFFKNSFYTASAGRRNF